MRALTIDLGALSCACTDHALEVLHKSMADPPDSDAAWLRHPNPLIAGTVEAVSAAGTGALGEMRVALLELVRQLDVAHKAFRPDAATVEAAALALAGRNPRSYTTDDWMVLVDWLINRYLPAAFIKTQAEYMAVRAAIAGKIAAAAPGAVPGAEFDARIPSTLAAALRGANWTPLQESLLYIAQTRGAEAITFIGEQTRHRMKRILLDYTERRATGDRAATAARLEQTISDEFGILNRDWRRIAVTETGNIHNEALVASLAPGTQVKRFEAYEGACPFCKKIDGLVLTVVAPDKADKDPWTEVWPGKSNVGRSASPRKRVGEELVERVPEEMWIPAAGTIHPSCRGGWTVVANSQPGVEPKTAKLVAKLMRKHGLTST